MRNWTLEERARQSALIGLWKPWEQSTGPKSQRGKEASSGNALKHGMRSREWLDQMREINRLLKISRETIE